MARSQLRVTSHVGRDILASAASFKTEAAVVWEYVVNSLQYVERGIQPKVQVVIRPRIKQISIQDNGRGMEHEGLAHFFRMHGENLERLGGRLGRGKFGTGKSAAFGIATSLTVDTRRNGLRNVVRLTRSAIDSSDGSEIPLEWLVRNESTELTSGTSIEIENVVLTRIDTASVISYIERHLEAFRGLSPEVAVNDHLCSYRVPAVSATHQFVPSGPAATLLGAVELSVFVSQAPLPDSDQGVRVTSGVGNMVALERAGVDRKEFGSYLFGQVDVPSLETFKSPLQPYDASRSLALNPQHPVAAALISFIGSKLEEVRAKLVAEAKENRKSEAARKLAQEANRIAEILNDDFRDMRRRLESIRSASGSTAPASAAFGSSASGAADDDEWVRGASELGTVRENDAPPESTGRGAGRKAPVVPAAGVREASGQGAVDPAGGNGERKKPTGGFRVQFEAIGRDQNRSHYDAKALTIIINLDHPVVAASIPDGNVEDIQFKRLAYEIAFSEYALALGWETASSDPDVPADDLLYEIRSSLNRVSLAAASLYRN